MWHYGSLRLQLFIFQQSIVQSVDIKMFDVMILGVKMHGFVILVIKMFDIE